VRLAITGGAAATSALFSIADIGNENELIGVEMSTGWTAAAISFRVSMDGTNFFDLFDDGGTEVSLTVAASRIIGFRSDIRSSLRPWKYIQLRSGLTGAPVNQAAARSLFLMVTTRTG
jgi:hypothetical protein